MIINTDSVYLINKPKNWTSFDVIRKLRILSNIKKIGHAGTLDPMAEGLLIVCTGKQTKNIQNYQDLEKEYTGKMIIGKTTPSLDADTPVSQVFDISQISEIILNDTLPLFTGAIKQTPPDYSAVKIKGERAYNLIKHGIKPEIAEREVTIKLFEIIDYKLPEISFRVVCSKGTYIRSLANDFAKAVGAGGAYLTQLTRTRIGDYKLEDSNHVNDFMKTIP